MKKIVAALFLALALAPPVKAGTLMPFHVLAQSPTTIHATGWQASIQVRPYSSTSSWAWAGGYLADGTFVQNGIEQPSPADGGQAYAFVWFQTANSTPLYIPIPNSYDFHAFAASLVNGTWTFTVDGRVQQTANDASTLSTFQVDAESWMDAWGPFPTQAMRYIKTQQGGSWSVPHLLFSPSEPVCGEAEIVPTPGLNLVFRSTTGGSPCYVVLS